MLIPRKLPITAEWTNNQTRLTLPETPSSEIEIQVFMNGQALNTDGYDVDEAVISIDEDVSNFYFEVTYYINDDSIEDAIDDIQQQINGLGYVGSNPVLPPWLLNIDYKDGDIDPNILANLFSGFTQENTGQQVLPVDILISQKDSVFDITFIDPDILADPTLNSAILISLFTDKRANNKNGWWGDEYLPVDGDEMGSWLWLLKKEKPSPETLRRSEGYTQQALQWLIDDKHLSEVEVSARYEKPETTMWLVLDITGTLKDGSYYQQAYRLAG